MVVSVVPPKGTPCALLSARYVVDDVALLGMYGIFASRLYLYMQREVHLENKVDRSLREMMACCGMNLERVSDTQNIHGTAPTGAIFRWRARGRDCG